MCAGYFKAKHTNTLDIFLMYGLTVYHVFLSFLYHMWSNRFLIFSFTIRNFTLNKKVKKRCCKKLPILGALVKLYSNFQSIGLWILGVLGFKNFRFSNLDLCWYCTAVNHIKQVHSYCRTVHYWVLKDSWCRGLAQ